MISKYKGITKKAKDVIKRYNLKAVEGSEEWLQNVVYGIMLAEAKLKTKFKDFTNKEKKQ